MLNYRARRSISTLSGPKHFSRLPPRRTVRAGYATQHRAFRGTNDIFRSTVQPSAWKDACCFLIDPITLPSNSPLKNIHFPYFVNIYKTTDKIIFIIDSRRLKTNNFISEWDLRSSGMLSNVDWQLLTFRAAYRTHLQVSRSECCMPRNVGNYQPTLHNIAEARRPHLHRGRRLK